MTADAIEEELVNKEDGSNKRVLDVRVFKLKSGEHFCSMISAASEFHFEVFHPAVFTGFDETGELTFREWIWEADDKVFRISRKDLLFDPMITNESITIGYTAYIDEFYEMNSEDAVAVDAVPSSTIH